MDLFEGKQEKSFNMVFIILERATSTSLGLHDFARTARLRSDCTTSLGLHDFAAAELVEVRTARLRWDSSNPHRHFASCPSAVEDNSQSPEYS